MKKILKFKSLFGTFDFILTEGALVERLKSEFNVALDPFLNHAGLIYESPQILEHFYRQYIDIGEKYDVPIMVMTPTRKVNYESICASNFHTKNIIADSCLFLNYIKASYHNYSDKILIGGLLGCKGDAYSGVQKMNIKESYSFHRIQASQFAKEEIDFLFAGIMPEINEAIGMSIALAETNLPYIISFMLRKDGRLLDGTLLCEAIKMIDKQLDPTPICYTVNCIHPVTLIQALTTPGNLNSPYLSRLKGIQANASLLSPEELNNSRHLHLDGYDSIVESMSYLYDKFDFKLLGGCCGTDDSFIELLTNKIVKCSSNEVSDGANIFPQ